MEHNANGYSMGDWYVWYISLEVGEPLFASKFSRVKTPKDDLVKAMCEVPDHFPFDPEKGIVRALTADMVKNPRYQATPITPAEIANAGFSDFWLTPGSTDIPQNAVRNPKDGIVAGFTSSNPGRLWKFMTDTCRLEVFQQPLSLILLQKYRDTNGRRIVIQIGGVYTTFCQETGILLQKYRDRNGRCIAILFEKYRGQGSM